MAGAEPTFEEGILRAVLDAASAGAAVDALVAAVEAEFAPSGALFYSFDDEGILDLQGGALKAAFAGDLAWFEDDPAQDRARAIEDTPVVHASCLLPRKRFVQSTAYREFYGKRAIDYILCLRLNDRRHASPGMAGLFLSRSESDGDFGEAQKQRLRAILPALSALYRMRARDERLLRVLAGLAVSEELSQALVVFSSSGEVLWRSRPAQALLSGNSSACVRNLAATVREAASAIGSGADARAARPVRLGPSRELWSVDISRLAGDPATDLYLGVLRRAVEVEAQLAHRYLLTPTEGAVLACLGEGMSNAEIAQNLSIGVATAKTHVKRILAKMGLGSRLQAALVMQRARIMQDIDDGRPR